MDRAKRSSSFATPQNQPKKGNKAYLKKQPYKQTNPQKNPTHTLHIILKCTTNVITFCSNSCTAMSYKSRDSEVTLLHHSDHTIYLTKSQAH